MALYKILKSFPGSQDGTTTEQFEAGTERELSEYLANAVPPGSVRPAGRAAQLENKAVITDGKAPGGRAKPTA